MSEFIHIQSTKQNTKIPEFVDCSVYNIAHNTHNNNNNKIIFHNNISSPHSFRPDTQFIRKRNSFLRHSIKRKGDLYG
jgi:hypothetical protein